MPDAAALDACAARANDLMALSRERIGDELTKLLAMNDPAATVAIMLERNILTPVLPEIEASRIADLRRLIAAEQEAAAAPDALRRLAALLPPDPAIAEAIAARLRLSNKARKRLACAAQRDAASDPRALAYRVGLDCAVDRLLLAERPSDAAAIADWHSPRLPISGGTLIKRGLPEGPIVARTLKQIEQQWVDAGFPTGSAFHAIVDQALAGAR